MLQQPSLRKMSVRPAAVAGSFYPAAAPELRAMVRELLERHAPAAGSRPAPCPKALIVPHAGYVYSGDTAAQTYARLFPYREIIRRVVLLGPAHRVPTLGLAMSAATHFASPLGNVCLDLDWQARLQGMDCTSCFDATHEQEHSLEVHLPFLQVMLPSFRLVPLVVGDADAGQVAEVLSRLWGGAETLIVISSDLSHYHDYATANRIDSRTCEMIERFEYQGLGGEQACGCRPLSGLLSLAKGRKMRIEQVRRCNSGDTAGDRQRVVGYGGFVLWEDSAEAEAPQSLDLDEDSARRLLALARRSIQARMSGQAPPEPEDIAGAEPRPAGVFVTLRKHGQLRGCIGHMEASRTLAREVAQLACSAAFEDPRFPPVQEEELPQLSISLSVLSPKQPVSFRDEADLLRQLRPGVDGLMISSGDLHATFLPQVWEELPDAPRFLRHLKRKAGIPDDQCPEQAWRYVAAHYQETD